MRGYNERYCSWTNTAIQCDYFNKVRQVKKDGKSDRLSNNINSNIILSEHSKKNIFNIKKAV